MWMTHLQGYLVTTEQVGNNTVERINFTKMNGLGNDFIILDYSEYEKIKMNPSELALKLCNRNFSIGADGLIIVSDKTENADISWIFYNSDGSKAGMCGNGMRCFARYVHDKGIVTKDEFSVETLSGIKIPKIISEDEVRVNMGMPILETSKIPFDNEANDYTYITKDGKGFDLYAVSMGNPHAIIFVESNSREYALKYGSEIEKDKLFKEKTNVEFAEVISRKEVILNVWERGCGITLACGTGACATVVAGILKGILDNEVIVHLPGGDLYIVWSGNSQDTKQNVFMTGKAEYSFYGEIEI